MQNIKVIYSKIFISFLLRLNNYMRASKTVLVFTHMHTRVYA